MSGTSIEAHDLSKRGKVRAFNMADLTVGISVRVLNTYFLCSGVRLTLQSGKRVQLQE